MKRTKQPKGKAKTSKRGTKPSFPIERTEYRRGAFVFTHIRVAGADKEGQTELFRAASPQGRIQALRPHAERLGVGLEDIQAAETLLADGALKQWAGMLEFDLLLAQSWAAVQLAQVEKTFVPLAIYGAKSKEDRRKGSDEARRTGAAAKRARDEWIRNEVTRLRDFGLSLRNACTRTAEAIPSKGWKRLTPDHIRKKIIKAPAKK